MSVSSRRSENDFFRPPYDSRPFHHPKKIVLILLDRNVSTRKMVDYKLLCTGSLEEEVVDLGTFGLLSACNVHRCRQAVFAEYFADGCIGGHNIFFLQRSHVRAEW